LAFHEVLFPTDVSGGSRGGPGFNTSVVELPDSGHEKRLARWSRPRYGFDVSYGIRKQQHLYDVRAFYNARLGVANGFLYKDPSDYATTATGDITASSVTTNADVLIGTGDGVTTTFQLLKRYTSGPHTTIRPIRKTVAGSYKVSVDGVDQGSEGSGWSVNETTGVLTFDVAPTSGHEVKAGFEFYVPVRFGVAVDKILATSLDAFQVGNSGSIPLQEIMDDDEQPEDYFFGGTKLHDPLSANVAITLGQGRVHVVNPDAAGREVTLPNAGTMPDGGWHFHIINTSATDTVDIKGDAATINTLGTSSAAIYVVGKNVSDVSIWFALT
jgi:uncharacterized protein (TIGR02217 family)